MRRYFDLGGLWKHVERCDRLDGEFLVQLFQVTRQCRGITRYVNQCDWRKIKNRIANSRAQASRGRIDDESRRLQGAAVCDHRGDLEIVLP